MSTSYTEAERLQALADVVNDTTSEGHIEHVAEGEYGVYLDWEHRYVVVLADHTDALTALYRLSVTSPEAYETERERARAIGRAQGVQ